MSRKKKTPAAVRRPLIESIAYHPAATARAADPVANLLAAVEDTARWLDLQAGAVQRIGNEYGAEVAEKTRRAADRLRERARSLRAAFAAANAKKKDLI